MPKKELETICNYKFLFKNSDTLTINAAEVTETSPKVAFAIKFKRYKNIRIRVDDRDRY